LLRHFVYIFSITLHKNPILQMKETEAKRDEIACAITPQISGTWESRLTGLRNQPLSHGLHCPPSHWGAHQPPLMLLVSDHLFWVCPIGSKKVLLLIERCNRIISPMTLSPVKGRKFIWTHALNGEKRSAQPKQANHITCERKGGPQRPESLGLYNLSEKINIQYMRFEMCKVS
jgi:hypothetical protein